MQRQPTAPPKNLARLILPLLLTFWLAFWLIRGRYAMLDDCFIHLRYADFLLRTHTITYDGIHRSFGTSSPLYVFLLALLRPIFPGPMLPKGLSIASYLALIALLITFFVSASKSALVRILTAMLIFCLVCPMGIRWLTDGMETPLQVLFAAALALLCSYEMRRPALKPLRTLALIAFGFLATALRIESATLIALVTAILFLTHLRPNSPSTNAAEYLRSTFPAGTSTRARALIPAALRSSPLAIGAILALATIRLTLGSFLPDTALAKSSAATLKPLSEIAHLLAASLNLGIGLFLLWIVSLFLLLRSSASHKQAATPTAVILLGNAILPLIVALACLRGQFVQGIRYLLWCLVFSTVWNICRLARLYAEVRDPGTAFAPFAVRSAYPLLAALGLFMAVLLPVEAHFVTPTLAARGATFTNLRSAPLSNLHADNIMSADVGYIGYFTGASICDVEGLVDGRAFASQTKHDRIRSCANHAPDVLFLNDFQLSEASAFLDLHQWSVCRTFDYAGVTLNDRHYLMVPRPLGPAKCPTLGGRQAPYHPS